MNAATPSGLCGLSVEEVDARIADPALIATHEEALMVMQVLDGEIADIAAQLDAQTVEAAGQTAPVLRQEWRRRAVFACDMRRGARQAVRQRDRELRGVTIEDRRTVRLDASRQDADTPRERRLQAEAEARKAARVAEGLHSHAVLAEAAERRAMARLFVETAADRLDEEVFGALLVEAKRRRAALLLAPDFAAVPAVVS